MASLKIVLGSASPRRQLLLSEFGFHFRVIKSDVPEIAPVELAGGEIAKYISMLKSDDLFFKINSDEVLITADTIVWIKDKMLGKPKDSKHAIEMLKILSGQTHSVFTGVTIKSALKTETFCTETQVTFLELSNETIRRYVDIFMPYDKAGAYGAQECLPNGMNPYSPEELNTLHNSASTSSLIGKFTEDSVNSVPLIKQINGSYFNVMGLPIVELKTRLGKQ